MNRIMFWTYILLFNIPSKNSKIKWGYLWHLYNVKGELMRHRWIHCWNTSFSKPKTYTQTNITCMDEEHTNNHSSDPLLIYIMLSQSIIVSSFAVLTHKEQHFALFCSVDTMQSDIVFLIWLPRTWSTGERSFPWSLLTNIKAYAICIKKTFKSMLLPFKGPKCKCSQMVLFEKKKHVCNSVIYVYIELFHHN